MDLVGREDHCALLRELLDRAVRGVGQAVVLTGEPGIGKTALLEELSAYARTRGVLVLAGQAVASAGPYRPFAEALVRGPAIGGGGAGNEPRGGRRRCAAANLLRRPGPRAAGALNRAERRVLQTAALLDAAPGSDLVPVVAEVKQDVAVAALEHAVRLHLLTAERGRLCWRHGLIREAIAASLLPLERRALARRAAAAWPATNEAAMADLLYEAGDARAAADLWLRLARMDLAGGALRSAGDRLDNVASTGLAVAEVTLVRVELLTLQGRTEEALRVSGRVLDQVRGNDYAALCLQLGRAVVAAGRWSEAEELVRRSGRPADPQAAIILADAAHGASRIEDAGRLAARAVTQARAADRAELLAEALCVAGRVSRLTDLGSAMTASQRPIRWRPSTGYAPQSGTHAQLQL